ncbi:hypothetical protein CJ030_MR3G011107 [Morella rubra]|uniref:Uncharacterized protein n=1 Tax=Morella rubra TaxID=262757 RepID=A0A6A1W3Z8_9ROSI|nr:hypothetical protein CJ030_MR3G011107 [Morella rubra]
MATSKLIFIQPGSGETRTRKGWMTGREVYVLNMPGKYCCLIAPHVQHFLLGEYISNISFYKKFQTQKKKHLCIYIITQLESPFQEHRKKKISQYRAE